MVIGFGTTVLTKGLNTERLDGIGVYSKNILEQFKKTSHHIIPLRFYAKNTSTSNDIVIKDKFPYFIHSGLSALLSYPVGNFKKIEEKIDLFFAPDHHIPHLKNTLVVATVMDIIPFVHREWVSKKFRTLKNFAFKKAILSADHIITISEFSKNDIANYFNISKNKISVISLGVDNKYFDKIESTKKKEVLHRYGIEKNFFIFIGTLQPRKNIIRIIDAFEKLPLEIKQVNELIIIGQNGWSSDELLTRLQTLTETKFGRWLNYVPQNDMLALFQSARGLVYPSLYEGFGLPIIESFASECPVISSNTTSIPEVAGDAALLVDPCSVEDISRAMYQLATDENLRQSLIKRGNERVKQFSWEKSAKMHLEVFKKLLDEK